MEPTAIDVALDLTPVLGKAGGGAADAGKGKAKAKKGAAPAGGGGGAAGYRGVATITFARNDAPMLECAEPEDVRGLRFEPTCLTFHADAKRVKVESMKVLSGKKAVKVASVDRVDGSDLVYVTLAAPVCEGGYGSSCDLQVAFTGHLPDAGEALEGIYKMSSAALLASFFEVTNARKAFPCIDAPSLRCTWSLSVQVPTPWAAFAVANGHEVSRKASDGGATTIKFAPTVAPVPAYVVGFAVAQVAMVSETATASQGDLGDDVAIAVYAPTGSQYPLQLAAKSLAESVTLLAQFFDAPLPHGKIDCVVLPDMAIAGMEHDGFITLNEATGKKGAGSKNPEETVVQLCVHEVAHHWLGNMVGLPFSVKEGLCQVLEQCFGDMIQGKQMRTFKTSGGGVDEGSSTAVDVASGAELTGLTYQHAYNKLTQFVASSGWLKFREALRALVSEYQGRYADQAAVDAVL